MTRVAVCIISKQFMPNYLFLMELSGVVTDVILISSKAFEKTAINNAKLLENLNYKNVELLVFSEEDVEEKWNQMINEIRAHIEPSQPDIKYLVNLTGGTKYISMAVQKAFEEYDSNYYYIPLYKNYLIQPMKDDSKKINLSHKLDVNTCLLSFGLYPRSTSEPLMPESYTNSFFKIFLKANRSSHKILDQLRAFRDKKKSGIKELETEAKNSTEPIIGLSSFLKKIHFSNQETEFLTSQEVQYLTGGWFEEYVYHRLKSHLLPDDIQMSVKTGTSPNAYNELDICFTLNNKFFVIECKTGGTGKQSELNPILYKSKALKESLFGLATKSYIFTLSNRPNTQENSTGIVCIDRSYFEDKNNFLNLIWQLKKEANT